MEGQTPYTSDTIGYHPHHHTNGINFYKREDIEVSESDIIKAADSYPAFAIYKDNYFVTGISLNKAINSTTADAKFQISIRHRLTKSHLPYNTFLYLTYTQKSFWNIYKESSPFRDINYNPSIGLGKYIIHNNRLKGSVSFQFEHESNGKEAELSRSWNMLSLSTKYFYNKQIFFAAKFWLPFVDGENNSDLLDYKGIGYLSVNYVTKDKRWWITSDLNPKKGTGNINTTLTAAFKTSSMSNQYIYIAFFNGYGDSLLDYKRYDMNIRVGICIKPYFESIL